MAGTYHLPTSTSYVSDSWQGHINRKPPSTEPGTDYGAAYGSPLYAPQAGKVYEVKTSNSSATGRFITIDLDDGRRTRSLHLSVISVKAGQRVTRGQLIGKTGASANGSDWGVGAHVHQTLWPTQAYRFGCCPPYTIDFAKYVGDLPKPPDPPQPPAHKPPRRDEDMPLIASRSGSAPPEYIVFTPGAGQFISFTSDAVALDFVRQITGDRAATLADIPPVSSAFFDGQLKTMSAGYRSGFTQAFREALGQAQQNVAISNFDELPPIAVDVPAVQVDFPPMSISLTGGTEPATSARD